MTDEYGGRTFATGKRRHLACNCDECSGEERVANYGSDGGEENLTPEQQQFAAEVLMELPDDADVSLDTVSEASRELAGEWEGEDVDVEDWPATVAAYLAGDMDASEVAEEVADALGVDRDGTGNADAGGSTPPGVVTGEGDGGGGDAPDAQQRYLHDGGQRGVGVNYAGRGTGESDESGASDDGDGGYLPGGLVTATEDDSDADDSRGGVSYLRGSPIDPGASDRDDDQRLPPGVVTADPDDDE